MKKKKYLPLYKKWMKSGKMFYCGLCLNLPQSDDFLLFHPTYAECRHYGQLIGHWCNTFEDLDITDSYKEFNELRQTIVLFLAAMNDEL